MGIKKAEAVFDDREVYKKQLRDALEKYGFDRLPEAVKSTVPANKNVLYDPNWRNIPGMRMQINKIGKVYAENAKIEEVIK